jgi:hypothetical protein
MSFSERRKFLWILFLLGLAAIVVAANATTLAHLRFDDLAQKSSAVARLKCLSSRSKWENGEIWTETQFEVLDTEKGLLPGLVTVRTLGGAVGGLHSRVAGTPEFRAGEEVYLFLWGTPDQPFRVLGWEQGTFRIARNARTGAETVTQDSAAEPVFDPATKQFTREGIRNLPKAMFREKLRQALAAER